MQKILSSLTSTYVKTNDILELTLEESPDTNAEWKLELPPSFKILESNYMPSGSTLLRTWFIMPSIPGTYRITCNNRKLCCNRRIISTKTYTVIVDN